ncbi:MAG TPA: hypothetical protein ENK43_02190 [Planctomycetes bacterium]|nr:hypothetical protein [Planctomycetota bacterium]
MTKKSHKKTTAKLSFRGEETPWWLDLIHTSLQNPVLDRRRAIFTNRSLRFERIDAVGFDFDHTLAVYNCAKLDETAMEMVIEKLIAEEGYDKSFIENIPEPEFVTKGLVVDIEQGNVLKVDRFGHVSIAYHGRHRLDQKERRKLYGDANHIPHVTDRGRYIQIDSAFAKPEVLIFSALAPCTDCSECRCLWKTIRHYTDLIHRDDSLKKRITASPREYLSPDPDVIPMLRHLREGGKKLFLLTNSEWHYTRAMMNPALGLPGGPDDLSWVDLFDYVVVEAKKPGFFNTKKNGRPLEQIDGDPRILRGGNIDELERLVGATGPDVLYVGDHIYSDLITSKRSSHWRTMLVISELEEELAIHEDLPGFARQLRDVDVYRARTDLEVHHWTNLEGVLGRIDEPDFEALVEKLIEQCSERKRHAVRALKKYIDQRESLRSRIARAINPHWGSLFRTGTELTYYGKQLEDFACTYTGRASNLTLYPTNHYFRSGFDHLPHEIESM